MNLCEISSLLSANVLLFLALGRMQSASTKATVGGRPMEGTGVHILVPALMIPDELFGYCNACSAYSNFGAIRTSLSGKCQSSTEATRVILYFPVGSMCNGGFAIAYRCFLRKSDCWG